MCGTSKPRVEVDGEEREHVKECAYLCSAVTGTVKSEREVQIQIAKATNKILVGNLILHFGKKI